MDLFSKNLLFSIQVTANVLILIYGANFETKEPGTPVKSSNERKWFLAGRKLHNFKSVDSNSMTNLADTVNYTAFYTDYLRHILKERVPGTKGHHEVKTFIIQKLESFGWSVTLDEFVSPTPIGNKNFTNIIATYFPNADRKLALAAHYDSKILPRKNGKGFLGATDAAVSCAMLLDFAKMFADKWSRLNKRNVSPMLIFTDGEEAVVKWSKNDSIYGSRHLARVLADQPHHNTTLARHGITSLDSFNAFILFDLIGAKNPQFFDTYKETSQMFLKLKEIERKLKTLGQIERRPTYFRRDFKIRLEDDHLPFLHRGVPILHLISFPYPTVWHKLTDDESALDKKSISELIKIFRQFLLEYFQFI